MAQIRPAHMKVICPTAKTMPVTLNSGIEMRSWFDIVSLETSSTEDEEGIKKAARLVHAIIDQEISSGIPANRIVLGGFSQGGALALYAGLTFKESLAGIVAFSCWLPLHGSFPAAKLTPATTPVFQCHGDCDPVVPYSLGQLSASVIRKFMKNSKFQTYIGMSHNSSNAEMADFRV